jgi:two-component system response regulator HydG
MDNKSVLIIDDEKGILDALSKSLQKERYIVLTAPDGQTGLDIITERSVNVVLVDLKMPNIDGIAFLKAAKEIDPEIEVVVMTGYGSIDSAVKSIKTGAYDYIQKPFKKSTIVRTVRNALEKQTLASENRYLKQKLEEFYGSRKIIGRSEAISKILGMIEQVAKTPATVLIQGESGTGKDVIAHKIHESSDRKNKPFVTVSCAALPESLLEAEIFGFERGAFTGAAGRRRGRFDLADQGTLFLNEIGEMSLYIQVKLLRFLQNGEFERLGGTETLRSDVRIIAATNANLEDMIDRKLFREDLYYRLNVIKIKLPPLRERLEDIEPLADYFLELYCRKNGKSLKSLSPDTLESLRRYDWPGNIRELENFISRAVVLSTDEVIKPNALPPTIAGVDESTEMIKVPYGMSLDEVNLEVIKATLCRSKGDKQKAARTLGISTRTIYRKLDRDDKQ